MKFKYLIILFIIIIIIVILITAFLPIMLGGQEIAATFRYLSLPLLGFMALLLICMSVYFMLNYRLFSLLEREDWPALSYYLEQIIYIKGRYSSRKVRLLASSYLVITDYESVLKLESKAMIAKPSVVEDNALLFGTARVLSGNQKGAAEYFKSYFDKGNVKERQWVRWYYGFSQLLCANFSLAEPEFASLAETSDDAIITGLSAYFIDTSIAKYSSNPEKCRMTAESGKGRVVKSIRNEHNWKKEADRTGTEIHIVIIRKYIDEAGKWLFVKNEPVIPVEQRTEVPAAEADNLEK